MKKNKRVLYIGDDRGYWQALENRFRTTYEHVEFEFDNYPIFSSDLVNTKLVELMELRPSFIYIDLSKENKQMFQFSLYLKRIKFLRQIPLIGLTDNPKHIEEALLQGFDFVFLKGAEMHDVVYHPYMLRYPKEASKKHFALAKSSSESTLKEVMRIGYFGEDYLHVECDSRFNVGDVLKIDTVIPSEYNKCNLFTVKNRSVKDLYYNYKYSYDLSVNFLHDLSEPEFEMDDAMSIEDKDEREKEVARIKQDQEQRISDHEIQLRNIKKKYKDWVVYNKDSKVAKVTKILIVDEFLDFLATEERKLDSFPYTVRVQTGFDDQFDQINKYLPNLIVYQIPFADIDEDLDLTEEEKNEIISKNENSMTEFFSKLVSKVNKIEDYSPFIIIFNCNTFSSKAFQDTFRYELILTNSGPINFDIILQMAKVFEKKQTEKFEGHIKNKIIELRKEDPSKYGRLTMNDFIESKYFISKTNELSRAYFEHSIEMTGISESEIFFNSKNELELGSYYVDYPFKMMIKLIPQGEEKFIVDGENLKFKGLIHSIGEEEKKELRRYVNEVYTEHKSKEREEEEQNFKELNEKVKTDIIAKELEKKSKELSDDAS